MTKQNRHSMAAAALAILFAAAPHLPAESPPGEGWKSLFNGKDLAGWTLKGPDNPEPVPPGSDWKVVDGVIDYNAKEGVSLQTTRKFRDYILRIDWRLKTAEELYGRKTDEDGKTLKHVPDSGVFLRGPGSDQANIWMNPAGSGEMWALRNSQKLDAEERERLYRPSKRADHPQGEWNTFEITMRGRHVVIVLNGEKVIDAPLPDFFPEKGTIMLQHHGAFDEASGKWGWAASTVQFRNIFVKELAPEESSKP